ncbi:hypothetical protein CQY20_05700 [Mycolicibacterium agri]|uniref:DUF3040 domain-containing protein n=1 Tax=Mycolicibacterium agri TaxID=36811 RepID=A0A2A7NAS0_MYCAG|nr:DUF3040 domain-containing protein [Mycolicibacterium agri]PEG41145.1 hypothetical protein CQY20_05700 [Mycolicibacterium agri]
MLSDKERNALDEIERQLRWSSPELVRLFSGEEPLPPTRRRARFRVLLAAAALTALILLGPRTPTEAELRSQHRRPRSEPSQRFEARAHRHPRQPWPGRNWRES